MTVEGEGVLRCGAFLDGECGVEVVSDDFTRGFEQA